ncbi:MAG: TIM barrel protein, partial [Clostridiales bacterium]|nr:TIM barrel protein [Clostridiales bacterium]
MIKHYKTNEVFPMQLAVFYNHVVCAASQNNVSTEEILNQIKKYNITGLEFSIDEIRSQEAELVSLMDKTGFHVSSIYSRHHFSISSNGKEAYSFIDTAARLKAKKVLIIQGFCSFTSKEPVLWNHARPNFIQYYQMNQMAKALTMICDYAADKNITVTLEDFDDKRAPYCTMNGLHWFMKKVPGLKYTFDSGNFQYCKEDELAAFQLLKDYISHVHLKDRSYDPA